MTTSFFITAKDAGKYRVSKVSIGVTMITAGFILTEDELVASGRDLENRIFKLLMEDADARDITISKRVVKSK